VGTKSRHFWFFISTATSEVPSWRRGNKRCDAYFHLTFQWLVATS